MERESSEEVRTTTDTTNYPSNYDKVINDPFYKDIKLNEKLTEELKLSETLCNQFKNSLGRYYQDLQTNFNNINNILGEKQELKKNIGDLDDHNSKLVRLLVENLEERNNVVQKKDTEIQEKNNVVLRKDIEIQEKDNVIQKKDKEIQEKNKMIQGMEDLLQGRDNLIQEQRKEIQTIVKKLKQQNKEIKKIQEKDRIIQEKNSIIQKKDYTIQEKDNNIQELVKKIQEKDISIQEKHCNNQIIVEEYSRFQKFVEEKGKNIQKISEEKDKKIQKIVEEKDKEIQEKEKVIQELEQENHKLKKEASEYKYAPTNYRFSDDDKYNPIKLKDDILNLQRSLENYITKCKGNVEINIPEVQNLLRTYGSNTTITISQKPLIKAVLQRHVIEQIIKYGEEYFDLSNLHSHWKYGNGAESNLYNKTYELAHLVEILASERDSVDETTKKLHIKLRQEKNQSILNKEINKYRKLKDPEQNQEVEVMAGEIIRKVITLFWFLIEIQEPVAEYRWFDCNKNIQPNYMEGTWEDDEINNIAVDICYFPLIECNDGPEYQIYTPARVIHKRNH